MSFNSKKNAAAQRAREVMHKYQSAPPVVEYPLPPAAGAAAAITSAPVLVISSPFPRRRATLAFVPHDQPVESSSQTAVGSTAKNTCSMEGTEHSRVSFVQPDPLPIDNDVLPSGLISIGETPARREAKDETMKVGLSGHVGATHHPVYALCRALPRSSSSPYSQLSYIFGDTCCPFTALFATLRAAGFTRVEGRKALLHKTHSLLWIKHLMPSTVDQLMDQLTQYRKVNHFPGTHWLGRKDKLCLLLRRASLRLRKGQNGKVLSAAPTSADSEVHVLQLTEAIRQASTNAEGERDSIPCLASGSLPKGTKAERDDGMNWADLTPQTWLLPADANELRTALREHQKQVSHQQQQHHQSSASTSPPGNLFIVKPANNAGGQGIFLMDAGQDEASVAAAEAALMKAGALPSPLPAFPSSTASRQASGARTGLEAGGFVVQRYMANPFLITGHKFDLRLYVVVTSYDPVRMYVYREGLVRIASAPYRTVDADGETNTATAVDGGRGEMGTLSDLQLLRAHLTNFTVNKGVAASEEASKEECAQGQEAGGDPEKATLASTGMEPKWSFEALGAYMQETGYDWPGTQQRIHELLRRTFLAVVPEVRAELHAAARRAAERRGGTENKLSNDGADDNSARDFGGPPPPCTANGIGPFFEFFGVDVLLVHEQENDDAVAASSSTLRPVLLEVNILPSLSTHYSLFDQRVKANFIADALTLVGLTSPLFKPVAPATRTANESKAETAVPEETKPGRMNSGTAAVAAESGEEWIANTFPSDLNAREACYTVAEEQRRAFHFVPLLPTSDSAQRYAQLTVDEALGVTRPSRYDAVLSVWAAAQHAS